MKKFFVCIVLMLAFIAPAQSEEKPNLTPEQKQSIQLTLDIFSECVMEKTAPYVAKNFSTEVAVFRGFADCLQEGENLDNEMKDAGIPDETRVKNFQFVYRGLVSAFDNIRNQYAFEKELKEKEKKKGERTL